jgi:hypothetical protein
MHGGKYKVINNFSYAKFLRIYKCTFFREDFCINKMYFISDRILSINKMYFISEEILSTNKKMSLKGFILLFFVEEDENVIDNEK